MPKRKTIYRKITEDVRWDMETVRTTGWKSKALQSSVNSKSIVQEITELYTYL